MTAHPTSDTPATADSRVEHLIVCRESAMYDGELLLGMINQTLSHCAHLPGVEEVRAAGLSPLHGDSPFACVPMRTKRARSVYFEHCGVKYLYSAGSAAALNDDTGDNDWACQLDEVIQACRPRNLHAATMARLLRSFEFGARLQPTVMRNVDTVVIGGMPFDLRTTPGIVMWQTLGMVAALERQWIVQRMTAGLINKFLRKEWCRGRVAIPLGYVLDASRKLVLDHDNVDAVREMLTVLADPDLQAWRVAEELGRLGFKKSAFMPPGELGMSATDYKDPNGLVDRLLGWTELWVTGKHAEVIGNPFPGVSLVCGLPVRPDPSGQTAGTIHLPYELDVPEGGWVSVELAEALRQRRDRAANSGRNGGSSHRERHALVCFEDWEEDGFVFGIHSREGRYVVQRWPMASAATGWFDHGDCVVAADESELHRSIVEGVVDAVEVGVAVEKVDGMRAFDVGSLRAQMTNVSTLRLDSLEREERSLVSDLGGARRNASTVAGEDPELAGSFVEDAKKLSAQLRRVRRELEVERGRTPDVLPEAFAADVDYVSRALANLAGVVGASRDGADAGDALLHVFEGFRLRPAPGGEAEWSLSVLLPYDSGVARLGPISGRVQDQLTHRGLGRQQGISVTLARAVLGDGPVDLRLDGGGRLATRELRRLTAAGLVKAGLAERPADALVRCPLIEPVTVVLDRLGLVAAPADFDVDPGYADLVMSRYTSDLRWRNSYASPCAKRQVVVDALEEIGGSASIEDLAELVKSGNVTVWDLYNFSKTRTDVNAEPWPAVLQRRGRWWAGSASRRILELVACPHCGGCATEVIRVPELSAGLLCPMCRRMPDDGSPTFPPSYLMLVDRPQRLSGAEDG